MTIEEKRQAIQEHCEDRSDCNGCLLLGKGVRCYTGADDATIDRNYAILFGDSEPTKMTRESILDTAKQMVCGHREQDYGSPENNFARIASLWSVYLDVPITPVDVAMMMALLKIARIKSGTGTADSFVDLAGYAACGGEIATGKGGQDA